MSLRAHPVKSSEDASAGPGPDGGSQATNDYSSAESVCKSPGHAINYKKRDWESAHGIAAHGAEGHQFRNVHIKGDARVHLGNQYTISDDVSVLYQHVQYLQLSKAIHQRQNILAWLSPINVAVQHSSILKECQEGTGQWLLQSTEFETWMQRPGETLLCKGMPGAGLYIDACKTMLACLAIDHLQRTAKGGAVAYIYCDYKRQQEQTVENLAASLVKQYVQQSSEIPKAVRDLYKNHNNAGTRPSVKEMFELLQVMNASFPRVFIIVDALDELPRDGQIRPQFLKFLHTLQTSHPCNLMVTSRDIPHILQEVRHSLSLEVRAKDEDIRMYIAGHDFPKFVTRDVELHSSILNSIIKAADGMFLLARLHMASLKDKWTKKDMIKALEKLPRGTDAFSSAYDRVVQRIDDQPERSKSLAHRTLRWITHAVRQMSVTEIRHALAIEPGERDLDENNLCDIEDVLSFCAGLVVVNEGTELVRFVHFTTQEYFKGRGARHLPEANKKIAMDCLTYIMFDEVGKGWCDDDSNDRLITDDYIDFHKDNGVNLVAEYEVKLRWRYMPKSLKHRIRRYPLAIYVFYNGGIHAKQVSDCSVAKRVVEFVKQDSKVVAAMQILSFLDRELRGISPFGVAMGGEMLGLHFATYFGIEKAVSLLLADGYAADVKDAGGRSSLSWASCKGHMEVVKLLLSRKDVDVNSRDDKYNTPLHIAAAQGYNGIVKQLLAHKDIEVNPNSTLYGTPLLVAAKNGHLAVIKLLASRKDIGINMKNKYRETALHLAARQGHNHVVQYLFQRDDVEVDSNSGYGVPWHAAVLSPCEEVAKTFLARIDAKADIRIDSKDYKGRTAFSSAAGNWFSNGAILELLLARIDSKGDIDVDSKDDEGRTPLSHAAGTGIANMVGHLLDPVHGKRNIDPNSKDIRGRTPLAWAALRGKDTVIKLFLKWHNTQGDIDVNSGDTDGNTPLSYAARAGYKARDRYLWNSRDLDEGRLKTARLLLADEDVDVNAKDNKGRSILEQVAARARLSEADGQQSPDEDQEIIDQLLSAIEAGSQLSEADGQQSPDEDQEIIDQLRSAIEARLQADARNIRT